jgi:hypothetical protein
LSINRGEEPAAHFICEQSFSLRFTIANMIPRATNKTTTPNHVVGLLINATSPTSSPSNMAVSVVVLLRVGHHISREKKKN